MKLSPPESMPTSQIPAPAFSNRSCIGATILACVAVSAAMALSGCGSSSSSKSSSSSSSSGSPVIVGTQSNSLPTPPAQTSANLYAGLDMQSNIDMTFDVSHPDKSYFYQQPGASNSNVKSGGVFTSLGGFEDLSETDNQFVSYTFAGFSAEIEGGIALLQDAPGGSPGDMLLAVPEQQKGCLAPNGSVKFNFLHIPVATPLTYTATTDTLYGNADLSYANGVFNYSAVQQLASGGAAASTNTIPFADSDCVSTQEGYGILSPQTSTSGSTGSLLVYIGATGPVVGRINGAGATSGNADFIGMVQPSSPIDLTAVTKATYKGFYIEPPGTAQPASPAYFGQKSAWITTPVFKQTATSLIGGNEPVNNLIFGPVAPIAGNILIDFGAQDSNHPGLFPNATIKEQDLSNLCPAKQQSLGPDGNTYCTFPVAALIGESYQKYAIFIAGPEPTKGAPLFYALVQD